MRTHHHHYHRRLLLGGVVAASLLRVGQTVLALRVLGLPGLIGGDYLAYYAGGLVVTHEGLGRLYSLAAQGAVQGALETATGVPAAAHFSLAFDNPPLIAPLFALFTALPPAWSFGIWSLCNVGCAIGAVLLLSGKRPRVTRQIAWMALCSLLFWPALLGFLYGQMMGLVLLLYALVVRFLRTGDDAWAGVVLALLGAIKPQYAVVLALVLVLSWRRAAVLSGLLAGVALALVSVLMVGPAALLAYRHDLALLDTYRGNATYLIHPEVMINWRAVLLNVVPGLSDHWGFLLSNGAAVITVACAALLWRGPWLPDDRRFGWRIMAVTVAALLSAYHSHVHGAELLVVPWLLLAGPWAYPDRTPPARSDAVARLVFFAFWPPLVFFDLLGPLALGVRGIVSLWFIVLMLVALGISARAIWRPDRAETGPTSPSSLLAGVRTQSV